MDYTYTYLIANLAELAIWLFFFWYRRDLRKEMLFISICFGFAGLAGDYIYTSDWWHPATMTGTRIGIESFLFGFWYGGLSCAAYKIFFGKKLEPYTGSFTRIFKALSALTLFEACILFVALFYGINSFVATVLAITPVILYIWHKRPDLIKVSLASIIPVLPLGYIWAVVGELYTPGWVENHWYFEGLWNIHLLVPLEDLLWGLLIVLYIAPLYAFLTHKKFSKYKPLQ